MAHAHPATLRSPAPARRLGGEGPPDASIVVPVNARGDLDNVRVMLSDLGRYAGAHRFEVVLVVNNFPAGRPPPEIAALEAASARVIAIPDVREPGVAVALAGRIAGMRAATTRHAIHLDADCRVPDPTAPLDFYVRTLLSGAPGAFAPV